MESWALVTGAGSGIGRGIVLALARDQRCIALVGRRRDVLETTANEARQLGAKCVVIVADLSQSVGIAEVISRVRADCGPIGLLINNAGVLASGALSDFSAEVIEQAVRVNLLAPMQLARECQTDLVACSGTMVLVASTAAWLPFPYASLYSGTKAGLRLWGESLRTEWRAQGVRVMVAYPPFTQTAMIDGMSEGAGVRLRLADPLIVGQRIVDAVKAGRSEWWGSAVDRWLARLERFVPSLVHAILRHQRERFRKMMEGVLLHRQS